MKSPSVSFAWAVVVQLTLFVSHSRAQLPAFSGADGAAANVTGGRGGLVYHVTRLDSDFNDAAPGTLRYGLSDGNFPPGVPRTIVFDVAGAFWLGRSGIQWDNGWNSGQSRYNIPANVTIAGQTAPGPVIIMGGVTKASKTNSIVRNLMFAPGYGMQNFHEPPTPPTPGDFPDSYVYDAIDISGQGIMIDHVTAVYITDEAISANELAADITIQYCNISQGQNYPQADAEASGTVYTGHALAHLLQAGSNAKLSILNNLYAHQKGRLPRVGSEIGTGARNDFRNNLFYNWLGTAGQGSSSQPSFNNFISNFYLAGPGGEDPVGGSNSNLIHRAGGTGIFNGGSASTTKALVTGNLKDLNKDGDPNDASSADGDFFNTDTTLAVHGTDIGVTLNARAALTNVLRHVGNSWWLRDYDILSGNTNAIDTMDERLVHETFTGTGKIMAWADDPFDSDPAEGVEWRDLLALRADFNGGAAPFNHPPDWDTDADGMPDHWELEHGLDPNVANNNDDFDTDGYTDLEECLNDIAAWPAPGDITFTGLSNNRYALIQNWQVSGATLLVPRFGAVQTASPWQPSRYDTAIISNTMVVVDSVGQHAGTIRLEGNGTLNLTNGWLKVADTVEVGASSVATLNLTGGRLRVGVLTKGPSGTFNFTGGTLSAKVVDFDLINGGGSIAPGDSPGTTVVNGDLTLQPGSSLDFELGAANTNDSDAIMVNGNLTLGGTLNVASLPGFGVATHTLIRYTGTLSGSLTLGTLPDGFTYSLQTGNGGVDLVVAGSPNFETVNRESSGIVMTGTGPANQIYYLLTSPNLLLPANSWTPVDTNTIDGSGQFIITNAASPGASQVFYRLLLP